MLCVCPRWVIHSLSQRAERQKVQKGRSEKHFCQDKDSLIIGKRLKTQNLILHSPPPASRLLPRQSLSKDCFGISLPCLSHFIPKHDFYGMENLFYLFGSAVCPSCIFFQTFAFSWRMATINSINWRNFPEISLIETSQKMQPGF